MYKLKNFFLLSIILISFKSVGASDCALPDFCDDLPDLFPLPVIQTPTKNILATGNHVGKCITQKEVLQVLNG